VINRKDALNDIEAHAGPGPRAAYYHKIMISPRQDVPVNDYRAWTRAIMHNLEQKQGKHLHWYAVQHKNTENYHVHIVIAGAGENMETGEREAVIIRPVDYDLMKEKGLEYSEFAHQQFIERTLQEINQHDNTMTSHQEFILSKGPER
jgi:hypothetical protein